MESTAKWDGCPRKFDGISLTNVAETDRDKLADALAAMSATPSMPSPPSAQQSSERPSVDTGLDADDVVAAPAPDPSVFAPRHRTADLVLQRRLRAQQTAIPVMLTCGVLLPVIGGFKWLAPRDSFFAQWDVTMPLILSAVGVLMLAAAVMNMLQVRDALRRQDGK